MSGGLVLPTKGDDMRKRDMPGWWSSEIEWLVEASEGEHGRRAVPLEPSMGSAPDTMDDMRCKAVARARRVDRALAALPAGARKLLIVAHEHVSPRRCMQAHAAHEAVTRQTGALLEAAVAFRRAWVAL